MTTWRLFDGVSGRPGFGSSGTVPPAAGAPFAAAYIAGNVFNVTKGGLWFQGYQWLVCASGVDTSGWKFALWQVTTGAGAASADAAHSFLVPGSVVTGGTLTAGQFNYVPVTVPLALAPNTAYCAAVGKTVVTGFPDSTHQFGAGNPYAAGITSGPLQMQVTTSTLLADIKEVQSPFTTAGADPSVTLPATNNLDDILWLDVQVTDIAPAGATYRAWPNVGFPYPRIVTANDQSGYELAMQFSVSQPCAVQRIWHYSPTGSTADGSAVATVLPTRCNLWDVASQTIVPGSDNTSPAWSGAAGSGWVSVDYTTKNLVLSAGTQYKVSTFHAAGANWFGAVASVFGAGQWFGSGFTAGPLTIPGSAAASPGQQSWNTPGFAYPNTSTNPEADFIDIEVLPVPAGPQGGGGRSPFKTALLWADL
jgi:hypothetical protein